MRIGVHVRRGNGLVASVRRAAELGCETIQVFAANPSAWHSPEIPAQVADDFRRVAEESDLRPVFVHTPYLLNLASPDRAIHAKSSSALADSMRRAGALGAQYVVTHIGSHRGSGREQGIERICEAVITVFDANTSGIMLLLENSAGAGDSVGSKFEDLRAILDCIGDHGGRLGVCLDTAHLWGAGYDISDCEPADRTLGDFDSTVGLDRLRLVHLNDTHVPLGSRRDRHANIGMGNLGERAFAAIVHHPALQPLAGIIETPARTIEDDVRDIQILKGLRGAGSGPVACSL